jgi:hypothetical protein
MSTEREVCDLCNLRVIATTTITLPSGRQLTVCSFHAIQYYRTAQAARSNN